MPPALKAVNPGNHKGKPPSPTFSTEVTDLDYEIEQLGLAVEIAVQQYKAHEHNWAHARKWADNHQKALRLLVEAKTKKLAIEREVAQRQMQLYKASKNTDEQVKALFREAAEAAKGVLAPADFQKVREAWRELAQKYKVQPQEDTE